MTGVSITIDGETLDWARRRSKALGVSLAQFLRSCILYSRGVQEKDAPGFESFLGNVRRPYPGSALEERIRALETWRDEIEERVRERLT